MYILVCLKSINFLNIINLRIQPEGNIAVAQTNQMLVAPIDLIKIR